MHQDLLPEAATSSRRVALEVLKTNRGNLVCGYHQIAKGKVTVDGEGRYKVNGQPFGRQVRQKKSQPEVPREPGHLHCGCNEDDVLLDFYFWKTWTCSATVKGEVVTEGMMDQRLSPRLRAFVTKAFREATGLTVDDLYQGKKTAFAQEKKEMAIQLKFLLEKFNNLRGPDEGEWFISQDK